MKKIIILSVAIILIITACEKKLDIDIPEGEKHIVVNGIINPDSLIQVRVSKSQNVLDNNDFEYLPTAMVKLYKDDEFIEDMISSDNGIFRSDVFPEINATYKLTVDYAGLNSVNAENILKSPVNILSTDTVLEIQINDWGDGFIDTTYEIHYEINILDNDNNNDYYFLAISSLKPLYLYNEVDDEYIYFGYGEEYEYFDTNDPVFRDANNEFSFEGMNGRVFSDELFNGREYTIDISTSYSKNYELFEQGPEPVKIYIKLLTVTEHIYRYITSYNLNQQTKYDPFAQPVQIYTNIENGLGLFSGYTMYVDSLILDF